MPRVNEKILLTLKAIVDPRLRKDIKAFKYAMEGYASYAYELCKDVGIDHLVEYGSTVDEIMEKLNIKNRKFLEHILDFLVGVSVLDYKNNKYIFRRDPGTFTGEKFEFLERFYPYSVKWTNTLRAKSKVVLLKAEKHSDTDFDSNFLELWDGIMKESPWSFRKIAIQKFTKKIKDDAHILDLGCGSGTSLEQILLECKKKVNIIGVDSSGNSIRKAKENIKRLYESTNSSVIRENIKRLKFIKHDLLKPLSQRDKYDIVFMSLLINHIPENNRKQFFKNVNDILNKNGMAVIYQIIHKSKFERASMWVMHVIPTHHDYPYKEEYLRILSGLFSDVKYYLDGNIVIAIK